MNKGFQIVKDFIEGKIEIDKIIKLCKDNEEFRSFIKNFKDNSLSKYNDSFLCFIDTANLNNPTSQLILYLVFTRELLVNKIEFQDTDLYIKNAQKYSEIIPDWLPDSAQDWVEENILNKLPDDLSQAKKRKIVKEEIEKVFPCKKRKPSWVQGTEDWPTDSEGKNLTFVKQVEEGEQVTYFFENEKTKEQEEIIEYY